MTREPHSAPSSLNQRQPDDKSLIAMTLAGQKSAFDILVTRYRDRIFSLAYHMLYNQQAAEDIAQEVFVRAYLNLGKFRQESGFYTWLYRIAVNAVYTSAKRSARRRTLSEAVYLENESVHPVISESPDRGAETSEIKSIVLSAIQSLALNYRQVLVLKELEGFEVCEVAAMLKLPEGTVKSRLFRGREALKRIFQTRLGMCREDRR